ncbi:MAG: S8 family serine peptidase [Pseudomonadota bacterium]
MRGLRPGVLLALALVLLQSGCSAIAPVDSASALSGRSDLLMVVIDDPRSEGERLGLNGPGYAPRIAYRDEPVLRRRAARIAADYDLALLEQWPLRNLALHCFVIEPPDAATLTRLRADARVRWVQPFNEFETLALPTAAARAEAQDAHQVMARFFEAVPERGAGVKIAVVDTDIDRSHPDLVNAMLHRANFAGRRGQPEKEAHGTAVVGLIAASPATQDGLSGLAQEADVHLLRGCWQQGGGGRCNTLTLALALDAAIDLQPQILNLSLSGRADPVLQALVERLLAQGTLVIAAYDEQRAPAERFPAPGPGVIYAWGAPAATPAVAVPMPPNVAVLAAPRDALSLAPMAGYELVSGHSIAAPQVAALAACLMARDEDAPRAAIQSRLASWLAL